MKSLFKMVGLFFAAFLIFYCSYKDAHGLVSSVSKPYVMDTATVPKVRYADSNDSALQVKINEIKDTVNQIWDGYIRPTTFKSIGDLKFIIDADSNEGTARSLFITNHLNDTLFKVSGDASAWVWGTLSTSGAISANAGLTLGGRFVDKVTTVTSGATTLGSTHSTILANATAGAVTLNLPAASGNAGLTYSIFKADLSVNTVTLDGSGSETIDGATTVVLGGNAGNSRITIVCDGTGWRVRVLYDEGTYTATLTGCTTSPTATVKYTRNGKAVQCWMITSLLATSNTTACTITGMPSHLWPSASIPLITLSVKDNTLDHVGEVDIGTNGVWTPSFYSGSTTITGTFTNAGTKGLSQTTLNFSLQ